MTTRRRLLSLSALVGLPFLAGCMITSSGGTTTGTLDVARIETDGEAIVASLEAASTLPAAIALLGANAAVVGAALAGASAALVTIKGLVPSGTLTASVDTTSVQAAVQTLIADAQKGLALLQSVLPKASGSLATQLANYVGAIQALLPFVALAAAVQIPAGLVRSSLVPAMSEADALKIGRAARG